MIKNYGIYNQHEYDNTLVIKFSDKEFNCTIRLSEEYETRYYNEELVSYCIYDFIRYAKIKYSGIIFLPADPLIDVINSVLAKYNKELLAYRKESGYITKRNNGVLMVYATPGTFLRDGTISEGRYVTYYDLYIEHENEHFLIEINEDVPENIDFFKMEAK